MKRVMLLGDSIRMAYGKRVKEKLGEGYEVWEPSENCRFARYTFNALRWYLAEFPNPDVVHWNNGLWDIAVIHEGDGNFTELSEYLKDMKLVLRELKKTEAKIIFATTTYAAPAKENYVAPTNPAMRRADIDRYNEAVLEMFKDEDLVINDLNKVMKGNEGEFICDDNVHPNEKGIELLSDAVSECIRKVCGNIDEKETNPVIPQINIPLEERFKQ